MQTRLTKKGSHLVAGWELLSKDREQEVYALGGNHAVSTWAYETSKRLAVPGGWLVSTRYVVVTDKATIETSSSSVFVPDPDHTWTLSCEA